MSLKLFEFGQGNGPFAGLWYLQFVGEYEFLKKITERRGYHMKLPSFASYIMAGRAKAKDYTLL